MLVKTDSVADAFVSVLKCMHPLSSAVVDYFVILYISPILPIYPPICISIYPSHCLPFNPLLLSLSYSMSTHLPTLQSSTTASFPYHPLTSPHLTHPHLPFHIPSPHLTSLTSTFLFTFPYLSLLIYLSLSHSIPSSSCLPPPHLTSLSPTPSPSPARCAPSPPART